MVWTRISRGGFIPVLWSWPQALGSKNRECTVTWGEKKQLFCWCYALIWSWKYGSEDHGLFSCSARLQGRGCSYLTAARYHGEELNLILRPDVSEFACSHLFGWYTQASSGNLLEATDGFPSLQLPQRPLPYLSTRLQWQPKGGLIAIKLSCCFIWLDGFYSLLLIP